ncbi:hypothetical protein N1I86_09980 [Bacillus sp. FSL W8-0116]|uniref:hypothetical protein n=1 Tax=Bacillus sp. FSL W8-0116 TaxID=2978206 RepID=UPI0030FB5A49
MAMQLPKNHKKRENNFQIDGFLDETLREGAERCLFAVDEDKKYELIKKLVDSGIRDIIIGSGPKDPSLIFKCLSAKHDFGKLPEDVNFAFILLLNSWEPLYETFKSFPKEFLNDLTISFGMVEYQQEHQLFERVVEKFRKIGVTKFRASLLNNFSNGVDEDKYAQITHHINRCVNEGFDTVRINDSLGTIYPEAMEVLSANLVYDYPNLNFCLHAHNDRGLGLQNALISIYNGFNMIEGAVAGYGNRSGLPAIETLVRIFSEKNITIKNTNLDLEKLKEAAIRTDEIFMTVPNIYRPESGLVVNKENLGVLNIPDYLGVERKTDYFLNKVGLHLGTVQKALKSGGFSESLINNSDFIKEVREKVEEKMMLIAAEKQSKFEGIVSEIYEFYSTGVLGAKDIQEIAEQCALEKRTLEQKVFQYSER